MTIDLNIDSLRLDLGDISGHAHRVEPVAARALEMLADRLEASWADCTRAAGSFRFDGLSVPGVALAWDQMSDETAARTLADALFESLMLKLRG